jgi:nitroreductase
MDSLIVEIMNTSLSNMIKPYGRVVKGIYGFIYDIQRFIRYGGWRSNSYNTDIRNYESVKVYHRIEKSMSFKNQRATSGWRDAETLLKMLKVAKQTGEIGYHDKAAKSILTKFAEHKSDVEPEKAKRLDVDLAELDFDSLDSHGVKIQWNSDFEKGKLNSPENFFFSRYSLREFKDEVVDVATIKRAISLAMKTPSVCNRQAWHIYHTTDPEIKTKILKYQQGNRGFGSKIPNVMIIATDLEAFMPGEEHYQHWIDGGLFSMSVVYALHSLGVASCCLNWSQSPNNDRKLRSLVPIRPNHTVIMMLAVGHPDTKNKVCVSSRRPFDEVFTDLK